MRPGDRLEMVIFRNSEFSGTFTIASDGTLLHPLLSTVQVAGVPLSVARERMTEFLKQFETDPTFLFQPQYRVYIGGAVGSQGQVHLPPMSVGQALILAGGVTTPNRRFRVRLIRDGVETMASLDGGSETELLQTPIRSGDQILLEQRPSFSRNYLSPLLQATQTITSLVATFVYLNAIFGSD